jgi:ribonucleoside-diphosphate reductase alpha chain
MSSSKLFTQEEAMSASVEYFGGDELAANVFLSKYALRNPNKDLTEKTPDDMHRRIARELARVERKKYKDTEVAPLTTDEIYEVIAGFKRIVPQGSPMYGIGNKDQYVTISNCYVLDSPTDSYGGIHWTDEQVSQISKRRGGVGLDLSHLRPVGSTTRNSSRTSSGIASWMERYSHSTREVGQDGRRGAQMQTLSVHHPEVLTFATIKNDLTKVTGANISVRLSDEFLEAVKRGTTYQQRWPVDSPKPTISQEVDARSVWQEIIKNAHNMAEPGLLFWDNIIRNSPADCYVEEGFRTISTNPCSELPLSALDSCRLLLLNLYSYVIDPFTKKARFDYEAFYEDAKLAQRLMDDIIDLELESIERIINKINSDPENPEIKQRELDMWRKVHDNCRIGRRTGTGITALGDTLAALGIPYSSNKGIRVAEQLYKVVKFACYESSIDMAETLGAFECWDAKKEKGCEFFSRFKEEIIDFGGLKVDGKKLVARMNRVGRRNIALLTTAPAGSVSILTQTTSGIEPLFMTYFIRKKKINPSDKDARVDETDANGDSWQHFKVYHPKVQDWMDATGETDVELSPWYGSCAEELDWNKRVKLQASCGKHVDHAISSTLNLPNSVTAEEVGVIYQTAWKAGCKGITVYRSGCRDGVLVDAKTVKKKKKEEVDNRERKLKCDVHHITVKGQEYFVLVGKKEGEPYEVFAGKNGFMPKHIKTGTIIRQRKGFYKVLFDDSDVELSPVTAACDEHEETITRLTSALLRSGAPMHLIVQQLEKVGGDMYSFARSVSRALKKYIPDGTEEKGEACPECGVEPMVRQEGCVTCKGCGWSKCM